MLDLVRGFGLSICGEEVDEVVGAVENQLNDVGRARAAG